MEHSSYITERVIPTFGQWVNSFNDVVTWEDAARNAKLFLKNNVDVGKVGSRGEVYECFEDLRTHAELAMLLSSLDDTQRHRYLNMRTLAMAVVYAVEHDGFDLVKWDNFTQWGEDIVNAM